MQVAIILIAADTPTGLMLVLMSATSLIGGLSLSLTCWVRSRLLPWGQARLVNCSTPSRWSLINPCQSVTPTRSLLTASRHHNGAPSGALLPLGQHFTVSGCDCHASTRYDPCSHCSHLCLNWSSTGSSPILSRVTALQSMFQWVTPQCVPQESRHHEPLVRMWETIIPNDRTRAFHGTRD